jgi:hypothetical protein
VLEFQSSEHGRRYSCCACGAPAYSHYDHPDGDRPLCRLVRRAGTVAAELRALDQTARALAAGVSERRSALREGPPAVEAYRV